MSDKETKVSLYNAHDIRTMPALKVVAIIDSLATEKAGLASSLASREAECRVKAVALKALEADRDRLRADWGDLFRQFGEVCAERDRLRTALEKYGQHAALCCARHPAGDHPCTCGFAAALSPDNTKE
jgi:hypothetical protein